MRRFILAFCPMAGSLLLAASFLMGEFLVSCTAPGSSQSEILPYRASLVLTQESWGCLNGQELLQEVTDLVVREDGQAARMEEIRNPEDRQNRLDLYLYFSAQAGGLPGYYLWRLGVADPQAETPGWLQVDQARLRVDHKGLTLEITAKAQGQVQADLLYAPGTDLSTALFTCPAAGIFDAYPASFLPAYEVRMKAVPSASPSAASWKRVNFSLGDLAVEETKRVALGCQLLGALARELSASKKFAFLWDGARISSQALERMARTTEAESERKFRLILRLHDRQGEREISRGPGPFVPQVRQMVAVRDARDKVTGGEVWIGVE